MFHPKDLTRHAGRTILDPRIWLFPAAILALSIVIELGGDPLRLLLRYERGAILYEGEVWRLVSGHLAHLGWRHLLLNGAGLVLVWLLTGTGMTAGRWIVASVVTIAGIDLGFLLLEPELGWYVGFSGLLHGLLAAGLVAGFAARPVESVLIGAGLLAKVVYEQMAGPMPGSAQVAGGAVIVSAHFYGTLAGIPGGLLATVGLGRGRRI